MQTDEFAASNKDKPEEKPLKYLTFALGEDTFAIEIRSVLEIIQHGIMTMVPLMPDFVRGVLNLRGAVVPVIDLQARFGRSPASFDKMTCIVIFDATHDGEKMALGLVVDSVSEVIAIAQSQIEPAPQFGTIINRDFIRGLGKVDGKFVIILEPDRALDIEDMALLIEQAQAD
jgi:purine-binding chemotaxis protein CheW